MCHLGAPSMLELTRTSRFSVWPTLSEEFIFRGVLQQWIEEWTLSRLHRPHSHLDLFACYTSWFRHFPNRRWAIIAGILGGPADARAIRPAAYTPAWSPIPW